MARIRTIKPEFWTDEKIVMLSFTARLFFIGLWIFADDEGLVWYKPLRLKMQIFPNDEINIDELLYELEQFELIEFYKTPSEKLYLSIPNFNLHQKVDHKAQSKIRDQDAVKVSPFLANPRESSRKIASPRSGREWKGMEEKKNIEKENSRAAQALPTNPSGESACVLEIFDFWKTTMGKKKSKLDDKRKRAIERALKTYSADEIRAAIVGCSKTPHNCGATDGRRYDDLTLILRDAEHIERFAATAQPAIAKSAPTAEQTWQTKMRELQNELAHWQKMPASAKPEAVIARCQAQIAEHLAAKPKTNNNGAASDLFGG